MIRPRANWRWLANAVFSLGEHAEMDAVHPDQQLEMFWRIWTRKEAIVKQRGGSAWHNPIHLEELWIIVCLKSLPARFATENFGITRKTRAYLQTGQPRFPAA